MKYNFTVKDSQGNTLEVLQGIPSKGDKFPTIILVPGFGADAHEFGYFDEIALTLAKNGFNTLRFSFAGTGKSTGDFQEMTIETQAQQVHDILDYTLKDRFTDEGRVGMLGHAFGAATIMAALPLPKVHALIFTAPMANPDSRLAVLFKRQRGFMPDGISERELADNRKVRIGPQFWKKMAGFNTKHAIRKVSQPILFIHGSKDQKVSAQESLLLFETATAKKRLHIIQKADHAFTRQFRGKVMELIVNWFTETLGNNPHRTFDKRPIGGL